jgi:hypothetical protein
MAPNWLFYLAVISLVLAFVTAIIIISDVIRHPQKMAVMNWVWPITALYFGPLALWMYLVARRDFGDDHSGHNPIQDRTTQQGTERSTHQNQQSAHMAMLGSQSSHAGSDGMTWQTIMKAATHCGAACTLGDIIGEWLVFALGLTIAGSALWPEYILDFALAYVLGIAFQYFAIVPMKQLSFSQGIWAAIKADTLTLITFEIGLFGWMALSYFVLFHPHLEPTNPIQWFMMQLGMIIGFFTSIPANYFLLKYGIKEAM